MSALQDKQVLLRAQGLRVEVAGKVILDGVNLDVRAGEVLGMVGPNGAGKTTLLRSLAGVAAPHEGVVSISGTPAQKLDRSQRARRVSYLPQGAEVNWPLSVANLVALGRLPHRRGFASSSAADTAAIERALERTETSALAERSIATLSGGERMRALVARMLAVEADVLLADEPVAALDPYFQLEFMDLFAQEAALGRGVVLVLHDLALAARYCDRMVLLDHGRVVARGTPQEVLHKDLLAAVYRITAVADVHEGEPYVVPWQRIVD